VLDLAKTKNKATRVITKNSKKIPLKVEKKSDDEIKKKELKKTKQTRANLLTLNSYLILATR